MNHAQTYTTVQSLLLKCIMAFYIPSMSLHTKTKKDFVVAVTNCVKIVVTFDDFNFNALHNNKVMNYNVTCRRVRVTIVAVKKQ